MSLRERCKEMYQQMGRDAILRQGSPVDDLMAFVLSETGRTADHVLDASAPLCLYFTGKVERDEFIAMVKEAKPNMRMKRMP